MARKKKTAWTNLLPVVSAHYWFRTRPDARPCLGFAMIQGAVDDGLSIFETIGARPSIKRLLHDHPRCEWQGPVVPLP